MIVWKVVCVLHVSATKYQKVAVPVIAKPDYSSKTMKVAYLV